MEEINLADNDIKKNKSEVLDLRIASISWRDNLLQLGEDLVNNKGGQIFKELSGNSRPVPVSYSDDFDDMQRNMYDSVLSYIPENELNSLKSKIDSIQNDMTEFMNTPADNLLEKSTVAIEQLIDNEIMKFPKLGYPGYAMLTGLLIAIYQERIKRFGILEKEKLKSRLKVAIPYLLDTYSELVKWFKTKFGKFSYDSNNLYFSWEGNPMSYNKNEVIFYVEHTGGMRVRRDATWRSLAGWCSSRIVSNTVNKLLGYDIKPARKVTKDFYRRILKKL